MVIALGLTPSELDAIAESEPELYEALVVGVREKWTAVDEILAGLYELTQLNYRALLALGGVEKRDLPEPVRIPRPGAEPEKKSKKKATGAELVQWVRERGREVRS
jgi:hypothetical protein